MRSCVQELKVVRETVVRALQQPHIIKAHTVCGAVHNPARGDMLNDNLLLLDWFVFQTSYQLGTGLVDEVINSDEIECIKPKIERAYCIQ